MSATMVVEMAPFTVRDDIAESELIAASERLEAEFLSRSTGYLGRLFGRIEGRRWADFVLWRSEADARAAMERVGDCDACARYFACMEPAGSEGPDQGVSLVHTVRAFGALAA